MNEKKHEYTLSVLRELAMRLKAEIKLGSFCYEEYKTLLMQMNMELADVEDTIMLISVFGNASQKAQSRLRQLTIVGKEQLNVNVVTKGKRKYAVVPLEMLERINIEVQ